MSNFVYIMNHPNVYLSMKLAITKPEKENPVFRYSVSSKLFTVL